MHVSYTLYIITLVTLSRRGINGASDYYDHGEEWVDPDPLSGINCNRALKPVKKEPRFVISCLLLLISVTLLIQ